VLNSPTLTNTASGRTIFRVLALGFLFSIFLLPGFAPISSIPEIRLDDLFVYLMLISLLLAAPWSLSKGAWRYVFLIFGMMFWMLITQFGNHRLTILSDYFEYYKVLKFIIVFVFFYLTFRETGFFEEESFAFLRVVFYGVIFFNLMHYFGILSFNQFVMPLYSGEYQLSRFGVNSYGLPDVKRMLGVMGNPNDNAIIMGFFSVLFIARASLYKEGRLGNLITAALALLMLLMCGSRTAFVAVFAVFGMYWVLSKASIKALVSFTLITAALVALVEVLNLTYISQLWHIKLTENASLMDRMGIWQQLWKMIKESPWIGYGPNKEYFYANNLHAESDYVLMTWRYGFPGLGFYFLWLAQPVFTAFKEKKFLSARVLFLFSAFLFVSALTNVPMQEPRINVLYALLGGLMFADIARQRSEKAQS
jgi:O-antigen ligase